MTTTFQMSDGDVLVSESSGQPRLVADGVKLRQDLREALSSEARSDNIGAGLDSLIGKAADVFVLRADITQRILSSLGRMQDLQARLHLNERPITERVRALVKLDVLQLEGSLTAFSFRAEIKTVDGGRQTLSGTLQG